MAQPVLIDTDMGVDDALAIALACSVPALDVRAISAVGGNVDLDQAFDNISRVLSHLELQTWPTLAKGRDQPGPLEDARAVHGRDGLGETDLPATSRSAPADLISTYQRTIHAHGGELAIVVLGPLTNLAAVHKEAPGLLQHVGQFVIMGGAVWVPGNVLDGAAEFNFYRDPVAAGEILGLNVPIRVVPLDLTRQLRFDESHLARLSRSASPTANFLARILPYLMEHSKESPAGTCMIHDALAISTLIWPELFLETELQLHVRTEAGERGKSVPVLARGQHRPLRVAVSVDVATFLERFLESLCHERFVV